MKYSSKILEDAVEAVSKLPSIGRKSALRLVLHLANDRSDKTSKIIDAFDRLRTDLKL